MPHFAPLDAAGQPLPAASAAMAAPCPFCGATADAGALWVYAFGETEDGDDVWAVTCLCSATGPMCDTPPEAVAQWSARPAAPGASEPCLPAPRASATRWIAA